jgi:anti-anti-sigma factor
MLKTEIIQEQNAITLRLSGQLDTASAPALESEGIDLIAKGCRILILDLTTLQYVSSAGLRAILSVTKKIIPTGGKVALCGARGLVQQALEVSGFDMLAVVKATRAEALAACTAGAKQ